DLVTFRNVQVSRDVIRGEIVTADRVSGAPPPAGEGAASPPDWLTRTLAWRTPRSGLEADPGLQELLDQRLGSGYQTTQEDPLVQGVISIFVWLVIGLLLVTLMLFAMRWMSGAGGSPFSFGRGRHKL